MGSVFQPFRGTQNGLLLILVFVSWTLCPFSNFSFFFQFLTTKKVLCKKGYNTSLPNTWPTGKKS